MFSAETQRQAAVFDIIGAQYDAAFPHKSGQIIATQWLIDRLSPGSRVLDAGCGTAVPTGAMLAEAGLDVTGIDVSAEMLRIAQVNVPAARFLPMDIAELDPTIGDFDAVAAFFSLLMLRRDQIPVALRRIRQLIRPGGYLVIGMVEADFDYVPVPFLGQQLSVSGYPQAELQDVLTAAGLAISTVDVEEFEPAAPDLPPERQIFAYCQAP